jgi:hypothetical protein
MENLPSRPERIILVKAPKGTTVVSQKRDNSIIIDIELFFSK